MFFKSCLLETFRYEVKLPSEMQVGIELNNGSWTGALGMCQRGVNNSVTFSHNAQQYINQAYLIGGGYVHVFIHAKYF